MHPKEQIQADLKDAMRAGDARRRETLRLLMAAFKQVEVDRRVELSEEDALGILMGEAKKRREAIVEMSGAGRVELAAQEQYELDLIETYLPRQLDRAELEPIVREAIAEVGVTTLKDMGQVMKVVMARVKGQADGKLVNAIVRELLS
ncbi:MAG: GatB/YqeY domain-containing protein [Anaerolineae bacterium]|nr:GatB/YqeY domain-containing protein [Anaerolineae bacterium]MEB2288697.1 GatB/YqeY domain-containing protein [Anaerolineae bacterium]